MTTLYLFGTQEACDTYCTNHGEQLSIGASLIRSDMIGYSNNDLAFFVVVESEADADKVRNHTYDAIMALGPWNPFYGAAIERAHQCLVSHGK